MNVVIDTNTLMNNIDLSQYKKVYVVVTIVEELDKLKISDNTEKAYKARRAIRKLKEADNVEYRFNCIEAMPIGLDCTKADNIILNHAAEICDFDKDAVFLTGDYNLILKARALGVPYLEYESKEKDSNYKGRITLNLTSDELNQLYEDLKNNINTYGILENQYVIVNEKGKRKPIEFRYADNTLNPLVLPDSKFIKGENSLQRCALDLLMNKNIPIKIIAGTQGSGKTYLTTKMGIYHIFNKGNYAKILALRNPLGAGEAIGFLKGDKEEKISDFFRCIEQYLDCIPTKEKDKGIDTFIETDIPFYIKGLSYGNKYIIVDEAEDMDLKILRLIGTRIESTSCVVFCGDYKQAEDKFKRSSGLLSLIDKIKGSPLVGIVVLEDDVRSEASKVFADI